MLRPSFSEAVAGRMGSTCSTAICGSRAATARRIAASTGTASPAVRTAIVSACGATCATGRYAMLASTHDISW